MAKLSTKPYLQKARTNKQGLAPVYIRYNYDGKSNGFATGIKINPKEFDEKKGVVKANVSVAAELNNTLRTFQTVIEDVAQHHNNPTFAAIKGLVEGRFEELKFENEWNSEKYKKKREEIREMAAQDVKRVNLFLINKLEKEIEETQQHLNELLIQWKKYVKAGYIKDNTEENEYLELLNNFPKKFIHSTKRTKQNLELCVRVLIEFHQNTNTPFSFKVFDSEFYVKFARYLMYDSKHDYYNNTFGTHVKRLKIFLNWVQDEHNIEVPKAYKKYKVTQEEKEIVYLTDEELSLLWNFRNQVEPTNVKYIDLCVFQNLTGLRYSDVKASKWKVEGGVLSGKTKKTKGNYLIPLSLDSRILEILEKYNYNLGIATDQKYNKYIKVILEALFLKYEINQKPIKIYRYKLKDEFVEHHLKHELMSSHSNRRGFCTRMWQQGYTERDILKMLGSKTNTELRKYVSNSTEDLLRKVKEKQNSAAV